MDSCGCSLGLSWQKGGESARQGTAGCSYVSIHFIMKDDFSLVSWQSRAETEGSHQPVHAPNACNSQLQLCAHRLGNATLFQDRVVCHHVRCHAISPICSVGLLAKGAVRGHAARQEDQTDLLTHSPLQAGAKHFQCSFPFLLVACIT